MSLSFPLEGGYEAARQLRDEAVALGPRAEEALLRVLAEGSTRMRCGALEALMAIAPEAHEARTIALLTEDPDNALREQAAAVLGTLTSEASGRALVIERRSPRQGVMLAANRALAQRFDAFCTDTIDGAAHDGTLGRDLVEALARARRLAPLRVFVERAPHAPGWTEAAIALVRLAPDFAGEPLLAVEEVPSPVVRAATWKVMQTRSPEAAFDALAPYATSRGGRATAVLHAVDEQLTEYSLAQRVAPLDPRWEAHCRALVTEAPESELRETAAGIATGVAYYQVPAPPHGPPFGLLSLPDDEENALGEPYPVLVLGFEPDSTWMAPRVGTWMPTLYDVQHQCDGVACAHERLVGFVLQPPPELARELARVIEDLPIDTRAPLLPASLDAFHDALRAVLPGAPRPERGVEAFVVSGPCAPLPALRGLPVTYFRPRYRPWDGPQFFADPLPEAIHESTFSEAHERELRAAAALAGRTVLRLAILWANSD